MSDISKSGAVNVFKRDTDAEEFITILSKGGGSIDAVFGAAPVLSVKVIQGVDYSMNKGLNKDFLVAAFGDTPVSIQISGMRILSCIGNGAEKLEAWYDKAKLSHEGDGLTNRVTVGLSSGDSFKCVLIGCVSEQDSASVALGCSKYAISLIGVKQ